MIERERRFLVDRLPDPLPAPSVIVQGYLAVRPVTVRVRRRDGRHTLTVKAGSGRERIEVERDLTPAEFDELWVFADELRIEKRRHVVRLPDGLNAELDQFDGELAGKRIVEVEFDSDDAADVFVPPSWFGREITDDGRYTNAALAQAGWPAD